MNMDLILDRIDRRFDENERHNNERFDAHVADIMNGSVEVETGIILRE